MLMFSEKYLIDSRTTTLLSDNAHVENIAPICNRKEFPLHRNKILVGLYLHGKHPTIILHQKINSK